MSKRKYMAHIRYNYKKITLGRFETAQEAAEAYKKAAQKLFGQFARW